MMRAPNLTRLALLGACAGLLALPACGGGKRAGGMLSSSRQTFEGDYFRTRVQAEKTTPEVFAVSVNGATKNLAGAREAGRHAAVKYCINQFGQSRITWVNGPDDADGALVLDGDDMILSGSCDGWA
ncbi:hypothetical protein [Pseudooceanicola aestuarii]|uniref:hypothetical protein n=1 Tax=Pseudooceanicola aestuarii TaxID=2697319 RepID=UPI0013D0E749|nr:hypothetical protein [Pseudooceanicola aestuarii]